MCPAAGVSNLMIKVQVVIGVALVQIGAIVIGAWGLGSNPYGYSVMIVGFLVCFWFEAKSATAR